MTNKELSVSELVLMKIIWDHEADISMPELLSILKEDYGKDYARTTVVTFLMSMANKGYVETYRKGKNAYVHALKSRDEYRSYVATRDLKMWFGGSAVNYLAALNQDGQMSREEIRKAKAYLEILEKMDD